MQMLHPDGSAPPRPIDVPILIGALGPKGRAVAEKHDGVFATTTLEGLEPGRSPGSPTCTGARSSRSAKTCRRSVCSPPLGPAARSAYHATYELYGRDAVPDIPGGKEWLAVIDERTENERHLDVHSRTLHPSQRRRPRGVGNHRRRAAGVDDDHRQRRRDQSSDRRPRREGRHRGRVPTVRPRHPPRAGGDVRGRHRLTTSAEAQWDQPRSSRRPPC